MSIFTVTTLPSNACRSAVSFCARSGVAITSTAPNIRKRIGSSSRQRPRSRASTVELSRRCANLAGNGGVAHGSNEPVDGGSKGVRTIDLTPLLPGPLRPLSEIDQRFDDRVPGTQLRWRRHVGQRDESRVDAQ